MVQCKDYPGIQFVKRIKLLQNDTLRKAEVEAYLNRFDQADKLYYEMDRKLVDNYSPFCPIFKLRSRLEGFQCYAPPQGGTGYSKIDGIPPPPPPPRKKGQK